MSTQSNANGCYYKLIYRTRRHISRLLSPGGRRAGVTKAFNLSLSADSYTTLVQPTRSDSPSVPLLSLQPFGVTWPSAICPSIVGANVKSIARTTSADSSAVFADQWDTHYCITEQYSSVPHRAVWPVAEITDSHGNARLYRGNGDTSHGNTAVSIRALQSVEPLTVIMTKGNIGLQSYSSLVIRPIITYFRKYLMINLYETVTDWWTVEALVRK